MVKTTIIYEDGSRVRYESSYSVEERGNIEKDTAFGRSIGRSLSAHSIEDFELIIANIISCIGGKRSGVFGEIAMLVLARENQDASGSQETK